MHRLIETSERLEFSLPVIGASLIEILTSSNKRLTVYDLLEKVHRQNPMYGENRVMQSLIFLFALDTINLDGAFIEINNENR
jgi:hypothetical protein